MPDLVSPGISVTVTDESFYAGAGIGTVPLFVVATAENKTDPSTSNSTAIGTTSANVGKCYLIGSQRELISTFGTPNFYSAGATMLPGDERNEYGLLAAYSYLGIASRAYVVRAGVDLAELTGTVSVPTSDPANGTYWLDTTQTDWGIYKSAGANSTSWSKVTPIVLLDTPSASATSNVGTDGYPKPTYGQNGDYVVVASTTPARLFEKISGLWYQVGSTSSDPSGDWATAKTGAVTTHIEPGTGVAPTAGAADSIWLKSTAIGSGANVVVQYWSGSTSTWSTISAPLHADDDNAVSSTTAAGSLYTLFDDEDDANWDITDIGNTSVSQKANNSTPEIQWTVRLRSTGTETTGTGTTDLTTRVGATLTGSEDGGIVKICGNNVTITASGGAASDISIEDLVSAINNDSTLTGLKVVASIEASTGTKKFLKLTRTNGKAIWIENGTTAGNKVGLTVENLGFSDNMGTGAGAWYMTSLWSDLSYEASMTAPTSAPTDGTFWYDTNISADMYIAENDGGTMKWHAYANSKDTFTAGSVVSGGIKDLQMVSTEPTKQSDGTALQSGDIWIDSNELETYPKIYKHDGSKWVLIDNTDQASASGIVFADAVGNPAGTTDAEVGWGSAYASFDADAPDPGAYPAGMLLWNTRVSGYVTKQYKENYVAPNGTAMGTTWVNAAGMKADGSPFMGRKSQRKVVVKALQATFTSNDDIRSEAKEFNLLTCPGYPETYDEMIALNTARKETAFIIMDAPFRLKTPSEVANWMKNTANVTENGEDGLVSSNTYSAVYYPSALTTDLAGNNVVVPASHIALRTIAFNDQVAFQWFAPAGYQRGNVTNATSVGYIDPDSGEYNSVVLSAGSRDTLYTSKVNPIAYMPNRGLVVFGQKTLHSVSSALDRVNVARLIVYLRYQFDNLAKPFLFELNDRMTRDQVTDTFERFLADLASKRALYDFLVVCDETNNTGTRIDANQLWIDVAIQPAKAAEFIYIPIRIKNTGESMSYS